ncbi:25084_t:CDS:1, partial [Gigaspora rosea]
ASDGHPQTSQLNPHTNLNQDPSNAGVSCNLHSTHFLTFGRAT